MIVLSPAISSSAPRTTEVANSFVVSTETSTEVESFSTVTMSPAAVSRPFTKIPVTELSLEGTRMITLYSAVVSPSGAVTVTVSSFSPTTRSVPPTTSNVDSILSGSIVSSTEVTPGSVSKVSPSATSEPLIWNTASSVFVLTGTTKVIRKSSNVSPSAARTVIVSSLSPTTSSLSPNTSNVASGSVVSTWTSTSVVSSARSTMSSGETSLPSIRIDATEVSML